MEETNPTKQHSMKCPKLYGEECKCDGYHTFDELYEHRHTLWIAFCEVNYSEFSSNIWRSKLHSDGSSFDGWFILGFREEKGEQMSYHLPIRLWEATNFAKTLEKAPEFDGHTSDD